MLESSVSTDQEACLYFPPRSLQPFWVPQQHHASTMPAAKFGCRQPVRAPGLGVILLCTVLVPGLGSPSPASSFSLQGDAIR